ncbi:DUF1344 domain-containing protein [Nitratireductor arenosus]
MSMRILAPALVALSLLSATPGLAASAEGTIQSVDPDTLTIVLDDGNTYKLPGEIDMSAIKEGIDIVIAYDVVNGTNLITDMEIYE